MSAPRGHGCQVMKKARRDGRTEGKEAGGREEERREGEVRKGKGAAETTSTKT